MPRTTNQIPRDAITATIVAALITGMCGVIDSMFQGVGTALICSILNCTFPQVPGAAPTTTFPRGMVLFGVLIGLASLIFLALLVYRFLAAKKYAPERCEAGKLQACIAAYLAGKSITGADLPTEYLCLFLVKRLFPDQVRILVYRNPAWEADLLFNHKVDPDQPLEQQYSEFAHSLRSKLLDNDENIRIQFEQPNQEPVAYYLHLKQNLSKPSKIQTLYCYTFLHVIFENLPNDHPLRGEATEFGDPNFRRKWVTIQEWSKTSKSNRDVIAILDRNLRAASHWVEFIYTPPGSVTPG